MTEDESEDMQAERRIERAIAHVSQYWFPVNEALLTKIQDNLSRGRYDYRPDALLKDVKSDLSLFTYCLRALIQLLQDEGAPIPQSKNPVHLMEQAGLVRLKKILEIEPGKISKHSLTSADDNQVARFKEILVSASTAEALSEKFSLDSDSAYSAAVLRQLGFTLIAWNYPAMYEEALNELAPGLKLEAVIAKKLGFSPSVLAAKLLHRWGISAKSQVALGIFDSDEGPDDEDLIANNIGATIAKVCEIGEALARAQDPERYPSAEEDWSHSRSEIEKALGENGMGTVQSHFRKNAEAYVHQVPHLFKAALILHHPRALDQGSKTVRSKNPWIDVCEPAIKTRLHEVYERISGETVSRDAIRKLVQEVIPSSGFTGGAVYTIDPALLMLVPQIVVGTVELRRLDPVDYSLILSHGDVVALAYQTDEPVIAHRSRADGTLFTTVSFMFGLSQRMGALYLEIPHDDFYKSESQHLRHVRAFSQALTDALNLK